MLYDNCKKECMFCHYDFLYFIIYLLSRCKLAPSQIGNCYHLPQKSEPEDLDTTSELEDLDTTSEMDNEWESESIKILAKCHVNAHM